MAAPLPVDNHRSRGRRESRIANHFQNGAIIDLNLVGLFHNRIGIQRAFQQREERPVIQIGVGIKNVFVAVLQQGAACQQINIAARYDTGPILDPNFVGNNNFGE